MEIHLPPKLLVLCIVVASILHFTWPIISIVASPYNSLGILLILAGILLSVWTKQTMQRHKTTLHPDRKPSVLLKTGPFSFSRNPFYVGYQFTILGLAVLLGSLSAMVGPVLFFLLINTKVIPKEEQNLRREFGSVYDEYAHKVRRWL